MEHGPDVKERPPEKSNSPYIWDLVMEDFKKRDKFGERKHGTRLQARNKRSTIWDLYQELLDAVVYIRSLIYEMEGDTNGFDDRKKNAD